VHALRVIVNCACAGSAGLPGRRGIDHPSKSGHKEPQIAALLGLASFDVLGRLVYSSESSEESDSRLSGRSQSLNGSSMRRNPVTGDGEVGG
jgi:hypothetical protein